MLLGVQFETVLEIGKGVVVTEDTSSEIITLVFNDKPSLS